MYKIFLLMFLALHVNATEKFQETRYIYAIDKEIHYRGDITFLQDSIDIDYIQPREEKITYKEDDENPQKKSFYMILKAIYSNDEVLLKEFFEVKKVYDFTTLEPYGILKDYIKKVEFKKQNDELYFLKIQMQNDDWILIETLR